MMSIAGKTYHEDKVARILEMSFDHSAAMLSLLNNKTQQIKADSPVHAIYDQGRTILRKNLVRLKDKLENLKDGKGDELVAFQHKCQEFGI